MLMLLLLMLALCINWRTYLLHDAAPNLHRSGHGWWCTLFLMLMLHAICGGRCASFVTLARFSLSRERISFVFEFKFASLPVAQNRTTLHRHVDDDDDEHHRTKRMRGKDSAAYRVKYRAKPATEFPFPFPLRHKRTVPVDSNDQPAVERGKPPSVNAGRRTSSKQSSIV